MKAKVWRRYSLRMVPLLMATLGLLPGTARALNDLTQIKLFGHMSL